MAECLPGTFGREGAGCAQDVVAAAPADHADPAAADPRVDSGDADAAEVAAVEDDAVAPPPETVELTLALVVPPLTNDNTPTITGSTNAPAGSQVTVVITDAAGVSQTVVVTVDALLRCQGQVLLIRRGHAPGKGLWALPGGFVEPNDTLWQSCLRELAEETHCPLPEERLRAALRGQQVFDHPQRSQRGRVITQAYFIDLSDDTLPPVRGGDDAAHAEWVPQERLAGMEDQFHDDHWHILDQFLGLKAPLNDSPRD